MFTYAVLSEVGEREINEDSVGFAPVGKDIGMVILAWTWRTWTGGRCLCTCYYSFKRSVPLLL